MAMLRAAAVVFFLPLISVAADPAAIRLDPIATTRPAMPDEACQLRQSGWVDLEFAVMPDGKVANVVVIAAEPAGVFDAAARQAVAEWVYPPQAVPVKMRQRLPMSYNDCRSEQLRPAAAVDGKTQDDCPALAAAGTTAGERFEAADGRRAVLHGVVAQVYSAPAAHCLVTGDTLKAGTRLEARVEYQGFSLVTRPGQGDASAVWVRSNQLKDVD